MSWRPLSPFSHTRPCLIFTLTQKLKSTTILMPSIMDRLVLEPQLNLLRSFLTLDRQTCGYLTKNADCRLLAICISTLIAQRVHRMSRMVLSSTLLTDQEVLLDIWVKTQPLLPVLRLKSQFSGKSPSSKVSASSLQSLTVFWVWPGQLSALITAHLFSIFCTNKSKSKATHSLST